MEARDFLFAPAALNAPAGTPFDIAFTNADTAIPHNVTISTDAGTPLFSGQIITGVATVTYVVPALPAGDFILGCVVHPAMSGTVTVR
jgi:plastocyanin